MIALIILGAVVGILLILMFLPLTVDLSYEDKFVLKIRYAGITLFDNNRTELDKKSDKKQVEKPKGSTPQKKDNFFVKTYKQKGLLGTVSYFSDILVIVLKKLWWIVKRFKFRKFKLDLTVATADAADTAIQYGKVCAAIYPVISLLQTITDFKLQQINIGTDFDKTKWEFNGAILVKTPLVYWIVAVISVLIQILKLQREESEKNERKQSEKRNGHNDGQITHNG